MKAVIVSVALITFCISVIGQTDQKSTSYNLHFNVGIGSSMEDLTSGPSFGLELINPEKKFSVAYRGEYPFSIGNDPSDRTL